jgi:uncharacterized protein YuzE
MADAYIKVGTYGPYKRSAPLCDGVLADYDNDGNLIGVEVMDAREITADSGGPVRVDLGNNNDDDGDDGSK